MKVHELSISGPTHLLAQSPIWKREVDSIQPLDLLAFVRSHYGTRNYHEAMRQVDGLVDSAWSESLHSDDGFPALIAFEAPKGRITADELLSWLMEVSVERRRAILFILETSMSVERVISLTWREFRKMNVSPFARMLANANPRHIRLDYVFWEPTKHPTASPLLGLGQSVIEVSNGLGLDALRALYDGLIPIDQEIEQHAFLTSVSKEHQSRTARKN